MKADLILSASRKVKQTGPASWICCCTGHDDKTPSMTVRELEDGRVLVHCFSGCSVEQILSGAGLTFDALFPDKPIEHAPMLKRSFPAADVLEALAHETAVIAVTICGKDPLTVESYERMMLAVSRILEGRRLALGGR